MKTWQNMIDYDIQPTSDDWKSIYTRGTSNKTQQTDVTKTVQDFLKQVTNSTTETVKYDVNGGYIQLAIRITNIGSQGVTLVDPTFALYLIDPQQQLIQEGVARAYQNPALANESFYLDANGGTTDLTFRIDKLDYKSLFSQYASARGFTLIFQSPQVSDGGVTKALASITAAEAAQGVEVRISSDNYDIESYVVVPASGATLSSILTDLNLSSAYPPTTTDLTLAIQSVSPDNNVLASSDPATLAGADLVNWRRWVLIHRNTYRLITTLSPSTMILPGESIYLLELTAKDVLGSRYRPVVYSAKSVSMSEGAQNVLVTGPLQAGDVVELTNVKIVQAKQDKVTFITRPMKSVFGWPANWRIGGFPPQIGWLNCAYPACLPSRDYPPAVPPVYLNVGDPVVVYEPVSVSAVPVSSISAFYGFTGTYSLPPNYPLQEYLSFGYSDMRLSTLRLANNNAEFTDGNAVFAGVDWTDGNQVRAAIQAAKWTYSITPSTDLSSNAWTFNTPPDTYVPFELADSTAFSQSNPGTATFAVNSPMLVTLYLGATIVSNADHICVFGGIADSTVCSRFTFPVPIAPAGITHPLLVGSSARYTLSADVAVVRLGGR